MDVAIYYLLWLVLLCPMTTMQCTMQVHQTNQLALLCMVNPHDFTHLNYMVQQTLMQWVFSLACTILKAVISIFSISAGHIC